MSGVQTKRKQNLAADGFVADALGVRAAGGPGAVDRALRLRREATLFVALAMVFRPPS